MSADTSDVDAQIEKLREGFTLPELEVKELCEKVRDSEGDRGKIRCSSPGKTPDSVWLWYSFT